MLSYMFCCVECSITIFPIEIMFNVTIITENICNIMLRRKS